MLPEKCIGSFRFPGKLLLSSEYVVLDGAVALAIATTRGQRFSAFERENGDNLTWVSLDHLNQPWFSAEFSSVEDFKIIATSEINIALTLQRLFKVIHLHKPAFFNRYAGCGLGIETHLEFPKNWGLGSSSTLILALAKWSELDPFYLLHQSFGGSGYDIACGLAGQPILYQTLHDNPQSLLIPFTPFFKDKLFFLYLGSKQDSRKGIGLYRSKGKPAQTIINTFSKLALQLSVCADFAQWLECMDLHETLMGELIGLPLVKELHFPDFNGSIKSLGAWGGDFALVASQEEEPYVRQYFEQKKFEILLNYEEMVA